MSNKEPTAARDVTARKQAEEELEKYRRGLEAIVADRTAELGMTIARLNQEILARKELEQTLRETVARQEALLKEAADTRKAMLFMLEDINASSATLARAKDAWQATVDAIRDPLFIHDQDHRIVRVNQAYAAAAGVPSDACIGTLFSDIFPKLDRPFKTCLRALNMQEEEEEEELYAPSLEKIFKVRTFPVGRTAGERSRETLHILEDITEAKRDRASQALLHELDQRILAGQPPEQVLPVLCTGLLDLSGAALLWIGGKEPDGTISLLASVGRDGLTADQYVTDRPLRWDVPGGPSLTGLAIVTRRTHLSPVEDRPDLP